MTDCTVRCDKCGQQRPIWLIERLYLKLAAMPFIHLCRECLKAATDGAE